MEIMLNDPEVVEFDGFKVFIRPNYASVIQELLRTLNYEGGERYALKNCLEAGDRVLEAGSAIGVVGLAASTIIGPDNLIAFEANPHLVEDAKKNHELNNIAISTVCGVLQNRKKWKGKGNSLPFYIQSDFWSSTLYPNGTAIEIVDVPTYCLEYEIKKHKANVLVCDIEGGEIDLLTKADLTGIEKIVMEIHYHVDRPATDKMIRKLIYDGFDIDFSLSAYSIVTMRR
jgi:FkbM family methyltransferase